MAFEVRSIFYPGSHGYAHVIRIKKLGGQEPERQRPPGNFFRSFLAEYRAEKCNDRALAFIDKEDYGGAIQWLDKALRHMPDYLPAHINMGFCHAKQGKNLAAVLDFKRALKIDPRHPNAHYNLGIHFAHLKCYNLSLLELGSMLWNNQEDVSALFNMANVFGLKHEYGTAVNYYEAVLAIDPEHKAARRNRDEALRFLGRQESERNE